VGAIQLVGRSVWTSTQLRSTPGAGASGCTPDKRASGCTSDRRASGCTPDKRASGSAPGASARLRALRLQY
jgi:hypothetical protein